MQIGLEENFVFDLAFEAEQGCHDVCAFNINHESNLSLYIRIVSRKDKYELSQI